MRENKKNMTKILELLKNAKVEWKRLWEVTIWDKNFQGVEQYKQKEVRKYHYYMAGELKDLISKDGKIKILTTSKTNLYSNEIDVKENIISGEIICIPSGGNPIVQYYNGKFITGDNRIATSFDIHVLDNKFLYYYMENNIDLIASFYQGAGIKHPDMKKVLEIPIPIPPIGLQKEIVRILDTFSELIAELQAELTLRKKQYEYYREMLLSFPH